MTRLPRRRLLASLGAAGLASGAGCTGLLSGGRDSGDGSPSAVPTAEVRRPLPMPPEQLREAAVSGGPGKDGIPSVDDPAFLDPSAVDFLAPGDPVFGVVRDGTAKAYPQKILVHHEIVNDRLAGDPVSVTYCPLTGTVLGFDRGGTTFGVSGRLVNDNLVMYDRATETWWPQVLATSIPGPWNEDPEIRSLREFRLVWTTWQRWREHNPDTRVLSTDTGYVRNYARDPYGSYDPRRGYYRPGAPPLFPPLHTDDRFEPKRVVMGARSGDAAVAVLKDSLRSAGVLSGRLGEAPVLAVYDPRYDTGYVYRNPERLTYERTDGGLRGPRGTHEPDALPLERVHTFDAMWFAWAGFYPDTDVIE